jgi:hypothetical protein
MVEAARETGKLLQIGHQRRSNPRYLHCYEKLLNEAKLLGRIVTVNGQWNRGVAPTSAAPERGTRSRRTRLKQYGFKEHAPVPQLALVQGASAAGRSSISARTRSTSTAGSSAPTPRA